MKRVQEQLVQNQSAPLRAMCAAVLLCLTGRNERRLTRSTLSSYCQPVVRVRRWTPVQVVLLFPPYSTPPLDPQQ
jgi:hypothetical protein